MSPTWHVLNVSIVARANFRSASTDGFNDGAFDRMILTGNLAGLSRIGVVGHNGRLKCNSVGCNGVVK